MIVDRRKDNYDELQILAGDTRNRRRRANMWTTGLIAGGMVAAGAYVATTNEQVDQLQGENKTLRNEVSILIAERDDSKARANMSNQNLVLLAKAMPELELSKQIPELIKVLEGDSGDIKVTTETSDPARSVVTSDPPVTLANIVWIADGSRRYPMKDNDILWIPEGGFWVSLNISSAGDSRKFETRVHRGERPSSPDSQGQEVQMAGDSAPWEVSAPRGNARCVQLTLHEQSVRRGFGGQYADIEVYFGPPRNEDRGCAND